MTHKCYKSKTNAIFSISESLDSVRGMYQEQELFTTIQGSCFNYRIQEILTNQKYTCSYRKANIILYSAA